MKIKMFFGVLVGFWLIAYTSYADELHKRDGSIIKGKIVEVIPNETYKIQASDGSIFVVKAEEVTKIVYNFPTVTNEELEIRFNSLEGRIANASVDLDKAYNTQLAGSLLSVIGAFAYGYGVSQNDEGPQVMGGLALLGSVISSVAAPIYGRRASSKLRQIEKYLEKTKDAELQQEGEKHQTELKTPETEKPKTFRHFIQGRVMNASMFIAMAAAIITSVILNATD